jgi:SAM-dependent methyltransferase
MPLPFEQGYFDCIVCADVIEHLRDPLAALRKLSLVLGEKGVIIASIPNVRYWGVISMLAEGGWTYADSGILDRTHLRFFTRREIETLFTEAGFELTGLMANIDPAYHTIDPLAPVISFGRITLRDMNPEDIKDFFAIQYLVRAIKVKGVPKSLNGEVSGEDTRTLKELRDHLLLHPVDMDALVRKAALCIDVGLYEEALESIDRVLLFEPQNSEALKLKETCHAHKHI